MHDTQLTHCDAQTSGLKIMFRTGHLPYDIYHTLRGYQLDEARLTSGHGEVLRVKVQMQDWHDGDCEDACLIRRDIHDTGRYYPAKFH